MGRRTFSPVDQVRWDISTERTPSLLTCNCHYVKGTSEQTTPLALSAAKNVLLPITDVPSRIRRGDEPLRETVDSAERKAACRAPGRFGLFCEHLFSRVYGLRTPPTKGLSIIKSSRPVLIVGALKPNDLPSSIFHSSDRQSSSSSDHELEWACESIVGR